MKKIITTILVVILFTASQVQATIKIFTTSGAINDPDYWDIVEIYNDTTVVNMFGGGADFITTYDGSTLNVMGGSADVRAADYSVINITAGEVGHASAWDNGTVNFFNSTNTIGLRSRNFGTLNMMGGAVQSIGTLESGTVNIYAGLVTNRIFAHDSSIVNIFGHDLFKTNSGGHYGYGQVWGFLTDDTYICVDFSNAEAYSHVNLIPEPATILLLALGGLLMKKNRLQTLKLF